MPPMTTCGPTCARCPTTSTASTHGVAAGVLGGKSPNAADLQIGASVRLLATIGDVRPLLAGRPSEALAQRWFADFPGDVPAGAYPAQWLRGLSTNSIDEEKGIGGTSGTELIQPRPGREFAV